MRSELHRVGVGEIGMALEDQVLPVNFGQGVDTKTDPKLVITGKLITLQNGIFTQGRQVRKRNGYTQFPTTISGGGNITAPKLVKSFLNELVVVDNGQLYAWSPKFNAWEARGKYISAKIEDGRVNPSDSLSELSDTNAAVLNQYSLFIWNEFSGNTTATGINYASLLDQTPSASTYLINRFPLTTAFSVADTPNAALLAGTTLGVLYLNSASHLSTRTVSITPPTAAFTGETVIATDNASGPPLYHWAATPSGGAVAYVKASTTDLNVKTLNSSGAVVATATIAAGFAIRSVHVSVDSSTGNIWVYYYVDSGASQLFVAIYDSTLTPILAPTAIDTGVTRVVSMIVSYFSVASTQQTVFYDNGASETRTLTVTSAGVFSASSVYLTNVSLFSGVFFYQAVPYLTVFFGASPQSGLFVIDATDKTVVGKAFGGRADGRGFVPANPQAISSSKFLIPGGLVDQAGTVSTGAAYFTIDFNDFEAYQATFGNNTLLLNGGVLSMYDGRSVVESGFHLFPTSPNLTPVAAPVGAIADGTYEYFVVFQWIDAQGNLYQSAPSIGQSINVVGGGGTASVKLVINTLPLTQKLGKAGDVRIAIYRTQTGGTVAHLLGQIYNLAGNTIAPLNNPLVPSLTFYDKLSDASIATSLELYTTGGVVENIAPPPSMVIIEKNNRFYLVDSENPNTVWFTKSFSSLIGPSFSDLFTLNLDTAGGPILGMGSLDEKLVMLKETIPYVVSGDGPNNLGTGSTLSFPARVQSDVGTVSHRSILTIPSGVLFKSRKGIYLLDRSLGAQYIGAEVESFNSQDVTSAVMVGNKNQVRLLTSSGSSLLYDYFFNQWSTFTNHAGLSADIWQGSYVYARSDGALYLESATSYLDNATSYTLKAQTSWLKLAGIQGFSRIRRVLLLGDYTNGSNPAHSVQISASYDFQTSFSTPVVYTFINSTGPSFQYRERLPIQKCDALTLLIEENVSAGVSGEYIDLTDLSIEVAVKRGANKLRAQQSVG